MKDNNQENIDYLEKRKAMLIYGFSFIGSTSLFIFGLWNVVLGATMLGFFELLAAGVVVINMVYFKWTNERYIKTVSAIVLFILALVLVSLYVTGGLGGTSGVYWFFTMPVVAFFLVGKKEGALWVGSVLLVTALSSLILPKELLVYDADQTRQLIFSVIVVSAIVYLYSDINEKIEKHLMQREKMLVSYSSQMSSKGDELVEQKKQVDEQNIELNDTKRAMLNLLEDSKNLEEQLKAERDRSSAIITSVGEGLLAINMNHEITLINPAAQEFLEVDESVLGKRWTEIVSTLRHGVETPVEERSFSKTLTDGQVVVINLEDDHYYKTHTGKKFPIVSVTAPIKKDGVIIGAVKAFRVATDDKHQQQIIEAEVKKQTEELQDEQAKLYSSINSLPIGFLIADASDRIIAINPIAKNMIWNTSTPTSAAEIGKNLGPEVQNAYVQSKHTQKPIEIKRFTFGAKFLHLFFVPIFVLGERGRYIGTVMLAEDITEATVLERSKDEFFSIASHELRTPLTAIRGNTSMLMDYFVADLKDDNVKGMIGDIHESSIRLIGIVNDFLDLSRLEQKRMEFKKEDLDIVGLSNEVVGELQANVQGGVVLQVTGGENIPHVVADKNKTKEVLINLVGNSLKFTESGSVSIQFEKREHLLAVKIVDTGRGIPEANQSLLFRKFQQAGSSLYTRDTTKGTGLGLYISKLLVEGMGGSVQLVSSEQGKGSVFEFTLPLS